MQYITSSSALYEDVSSVMEIQSGNCRTCPSPLIQTRSTLFSYSLRLLWALSSFLFTMTRLILSDPFAVLTTRSSPAPRSWRLSLVVYSLQSCSAGINFKEKRNRGRKKKREKNRIEEEEEEEEPAALGRPKTERAREKPLWIG